MAKQKKPVAKNRVPSGDNDSLLLRSAESLGRLIGALQREIDRLAEHLPATTAKSASPRKAKPKRSKPRKARL
jgi:uncharacterized small protein (DUF1192 family)